MIYSTQSALNTMAENLILHTYSLHAPMFYSMDADTEHKRTVVANLLQDYSFFFVNYDDILIPNHPILISIVLQMIFHLHGGKHFVDFSNMDIVFALASTVVCCTLKEYKTGRYVQLEFGGEMCSIFDTCLEKIKEIRGNPVLRSLLDAMKTRVVAHSGQLVTSD